MGASVQCVLHWMQKIASIPESWPIPPNMPPASTVRFVTQWVPAPSPEPPLDAPPVSAPPRDAPPVVAPPLDDPPADIPPDAAPSPAAPPTSVVPPPSPELLPQPNMSGSKSTVANRQGRAATLVDGRENTVWRCEDNLGASLRGRVLDERVGARCTHPKTVTDVSEPSSPVEMQIQPISYRLRTKVWTWRKVSWKRSRRSTQRSSLHSLAPSGRADSRSDNSLVMSFD